MRAGRWHRLAPPLPSPLRVAVRRRVASYARTAPLALALFVAPVFAIIAGASSPAARCTRGSSSR
jgi:hypothetical protein